MPYRQAAEIPGLNWQKTYSDFYPGREVPEGLENTNEFLPNLDQLSDTDLPALLKLSTTVSKMGMQNSYYLLFVNLINKAIVLTLGNYPEAFEALSTKEKEKIIGMKEELPDDEAVFNQVYIYTQRRMALPYTTINNGASMESTLKRANEFEGEKSKPLIDDRMSKALCSMDSQYNLYFWQNRPLGK